MLTVFYELKSLNFNKFSRYNVRKFGRLLEYGLDRVKGDNDRTLCRDTYADTIHSLIKMLLSWTMNCSKYVASTTSGI